VPLGYLFGVVIVAVCTALCLFPLREPPERGKVSWALTMVVNELPHLALALLVAATFLAFAQGDIDNPAAWAVVWLAALTAAGLGVVIWRSLKARPVIVAALSRGLGPDWRTEIDPARAERLRREQPWKSILLWPWWVRRPDVVRMKNVPYGDAGRANQLDVYLPKEAAATGPVLVHFHGGGFRGGRKSREARTLLYRLAGQGWVCLSANYRVAPAAHWPDYLVDAKQAIAWARDHVPSYAAQADTSMIFVAGSSAGAHLAAMLALTPGDPKLQPGFEDVDASVAGAICLYGYYGPVDGTAVSSPLNHDGAVAAPLFVVHGDQDTFTHVEDARELADNVWRTSGNPVVYAELPGAQHTFDLFGSVRFEAVVDGVEAFAAWVATARDRAADEG
jgi:acetyl esterase/lipase